MQQLNLFTGPYDLGKRKFLFSTYLVPQLRRLLTQRGLTNEPKGLIVLADLDQEKLIQVLHRANTFMTIIQLLFGNEKISGEFLEERPGKMFTST